MGEVNRRELLHAGVGLAAAAVGAEVPKKGKTPNGYKKALKWYMIQEGKTVLDKFQLVADLGFDGIELDAPSRLDVKEVLKARDKTGLEVPGVVDSVHWGKPLNHPDPKVRAEGVDGLRKALADAKAYGASTVLLVPAVVNEKWAYDDAWKLSQSEIRKVLPLCEKLGVKIAIENVWNNFLLSPLEMARYIDDFKSDHIGVHFDVGNIVLYGWPEQWVRILGKRIFKLDIKEYSRKKADKEGRWAGFRVELHEGDSGWPAVMKALREVKYVGWGACEHYRGGDRKYLTRIASDMDKIFTS